MYKKIAFLFLITCLVASCGRRSGCPANDFGQEQAQDGYMKKSLKKSKKGSSSLFPKNYNKKKKKS